MVRVATSEAVRTLEGFSWKILGAITSFTHFSLTLFLPQFLPVSNQEAGMPVGREGRGGNGPSLSTLLNLTERCHLSVQLCDDG